MPISGHIWVRISNGPDIERSGYRISRYSTVESTVDGSNGRAVALYPADPGSNPRSCSVWDLVVSKYRIWYTFRGNKYPQKSLRYSSACHNPSNWGQGTGKWHCPEGSEVQITVQTNVSLEHCLFELQLPTEYRTVRFSNGQFRTLFVSGFRILA